MLKRSLFGSQPGLSVWRPLSCGLSLALGVVAAGLLLALAGGQAAAAPPTRPAQPDIVVSTTIQAAIDVAPSNSYVLIPAGHYTESLTLTKTVSLIGAQASTTIIHALPAQRVLTVSGGAINNSTVISGLTFTGGDVAGDGGGIGVDTFAQPHLENLIITGNQASGSGGGLTAAASSPLRLDNVSFINNTAHSYAGGAYLLDGLTVQGGLFQGNSCLDVNCPGGGLVMGGSGLLALADVQFISNTSHSSGGGAYALVPMSAQDSLFQGNSCSDAGGCVGGGLAANQALALTNTNFLSNTSTGSGGGVNGVMVVTLSGGRFQGNQCLRSDCYGAGLVGNINLALSGTQLISNTAFGVGGGGAVVGPGAKLQGALFQGNAALGSLYGGGGLLAIGDAAVTDTQFIANRTLGGGGGLRFESAGNGRLVNDLFAGNSAAGAGQALALNTPGTAVILNSTVVSRGVAGGSAIAVLSGTVGITNSLIASYTVGISRAAGTAFEDYNLFAGVAITTSGTVAGGSHSHSGAAGFRNPAAADYHLAFGSAAINAGADAGVSVDFEGDPRPIGSAADIGFDEARLVALVLSNTDGQSTVQSGAMLTYTILINNTGPSIATGVIVSDSLPAGLIGTGWTCLASAGSSCLAAGNGPLHTIVTVASDSFVQITLHANVNPNSNGQIVNTVSATAPASLVNTNAANNSATDSTTIVGGPGYQLYLPLVER